MHLQLLLVFKNLFTPLNETFFFFFLFSFFFFFLLFILYILYLIAPAESLGTKLLLNAQQLVVLGQSLRPAWCSSLDLTCSESDHQVSNEVILCLSTAVAHHHLHVVLI
jgi:hypothetical protein